VIGLLIAKGAEVNYYDPFIPSIQDEGWGLSSVGDLDDEVSRADCVVIITDHSDVDYEMIANSASFVFDARNVMGARGLVAENIERM
jgi:UDP-N-acetyl-D-glucosamine dehydrogenase